MPVRLDEITPDVDFIPGTPRSAIVVFLYRNPEFGYRPSEIQNQLDIQYGTVTKALEDLHDNGHIGKTTDGHYHAINRREDLLRYPSSIDQLERMFEEKDYEEHTDIESPQTDIDEAELDAEVERIEAELADELED